MSSEFNALRAQQEIVAGLAEARKVVSLKAAEAERRMGEAEAECNAMRKVLAACDAVLEIEGLKLANLKSGAERGARS